MTNNKEEEWTKRLKEGLLNGTLAAKTGVKFNPLVAFIKSERENVRRETKEQAISKVENQINEINRKGAALLLSGQVAGLKRAIEILTNLDTLNHEEIH